jgi:hypothetical protein
MLLFCHDNSMAIVQLLHRPVRIYQPTRNTMQSGGAKGEKWRIDWDTLPAAGRWENPLMGWASSADYMQGTRMSFNSKDDAVRFAEKQGWDYYIQPPTIKVGGSSMHAPRIEMALTTLCTENSSKELRGKLCLQAAYTEDCQDEIMCMEYLLASCSFNERVYFSFVSTPSSPS